MLRNFNVPFFDPSDTLHIMIHTFYADLSLTIHIDCNHIAYDFFAGRRKSISFKESFFYGFIWIRHNNIDLAVSHYRV